MMRFLGRRCIVAALLQASLSATDALAETLPEKIERLEREVKAIENRLNVLEGKRQTQGDIVVAPSSPVKSDLNAAQNAVITSYRDLERVSIPADWNQLHKVSVLVSPAADLPGGERELLNRFAKEYVSSGKGVLCIIAVAVIDEKDILGLSRLNTVIRSLIATGVNRSYLKIAADPDHVTRLYQFPNNLRIDVAILK